MPDALTFVRAHCALEAPPPGPLPAAAAVAECAAGHAVLPLVLARTPHAPAPWRAVLAARARRGVAQGLLVAHHLHRALTALAEAGVDAVPLKGPPLADALWGGEGARPSRDADLLVRPDDVPRAAAALEALGFAPAPARGPTNQLVFRGAAHALVELHWRTGPPSWRTVVDPFAAPCRLATARWRGLDVLSLPDEELLLYLCQHGARHAWERFAWVRDVALLVARGAIDPRRLDALARTLRARRALSLGLALAEEFGAPALPVVRTRISGRTRGLIAHAQRQQGPAPERRVAWTCLEGLLDRAIFLRHAAPRFLAPNERDRAFVRLPRGLGFLYWLVRPVRLARDRSGTLPAA